MLFNSLNAAHENVGTLGRIEAPDLDISNHINGIWLALRLPHHERMVNLKPAIRKEDHMKNNHRIAGLIPALLVAGYLIPSSVKATIGDSETITQLLAEAKSEALELKHDSEQMESFTKSRVSWQSYAHKIEMIKGHVNKTGELLAKMKDAEAAGAAWQQTAIQRIEPLLKELADNTTATINRLNEQPSRVHLPEFRDYVKANYELASDLEALIRDFVNYGEAQSNVERLGGKLEVDR